MKKIYALCLGVSSVFGAADDAPPESVSNVFFVNEPTSSMSEGEGPVLILAPVHSGVDVHQLRLGMRKIALKGLCESIDPFLKKLHDFKQNAIVIRELYGRSSKPYFAFAVVDYNQCLQELNDYYTSPTLNMNEENIAATVTYIKEDCLSFVDRYTELLKQYTLDSKLEPPVLASIFAATAKLSRQMYEFFEQYHQLVLNLIWITCDEREFHETYGLFHTARMDLWYLQQEWNRRNQLASQGYTQSSSQVHFQEDEIAPPQFYPVSVPELQLSQPIESPRKKNFWQRISPRKTSPRSSSGTSPVSSPRSIPTASPRLKRTTSDSRLKSSVGKPVIPALDLSKAKSSSSSSSSISDRSHKKSSPGKSPRSLGFLKRR